MFFLPLLPARLGAVLLILCTAARLCAESAPPEDPIVVVVNGGPLRESEVLAEVDERINQYAARTAAHGLLYEESSRAQTRLALREEAVQALVERRLIAQRLASEGLGVSEEEVAVAFERKRAERGQSQAEAEAELAAQGKSLRWTLERLRWNQLGVLKLRERHDPLRRTTTEAEARVAYAATPEAWHQPEQRRVRRILILATPDHDAAFRARARERAEALLQRLKAGEDFETLARAESEDVHTRAQGGDRGWSARGWVTAPENDPFGTAAFALPQVGALSPVVETIDGFELLQLTGLRPERQRPFEEVRGELLARADYQRVATFWAGFSRTLQQEACIDWSPAELERRAREQRQAAAALAEARASAPPSALARPAPQAEVLR